MVSASKSAAARQTSFRPFSYDEDFPPLPTRTPPTQTPLVPDYQAATDAFTAHTEYRGIPTLAPQIRVINFDFPSDVEEANELQQANHSDESAAVAAEASAEAIAVRRDEEYYDNATLMRLSPSIHQVVEIQLSHDHRNDAYTPIFGSNTEFVPALGIINLDASISTGPTSRVFNIFGRPDLVIKYQANLHFASGSIHPLVRDYWFTDHAAQLGVAPKPLFLSPSKRLPTFVDRKTNFQLSIQSRMLAVSQASTVRYMITKKVGMSLSDVSKKKGPLIMRNVFVIGIQLFEAIATLHRNGIIHGDLHSGNVCLKIDLPEIILIDFGQSLFVDEEIEAFIGKPSKPHFQHTPWQLEGYKYARRDDAFKALVLMAEMAIGSHRFWAGKHELSMYDPENLLLWKQKGSFSGRLNSILSRTTSLLVTKSDRRCERIWRKLRH